MKLTTGLYHIPVKSYLSLGGLYNCKIAMLAQTLHVKYLYRSFYVVFDSESYETNHRSLSYSREKLFKFRRTFSKVAILAQTLHINIYTRCFDVVFDYESNETKRSSLSYSREKIFKIWGTFHILTMCLFYKQEKYKYISFHLFYNYV